MITDLRVQHFRSYRDESFEFERGVNIIVGPNASGKTNLLEAIMVGCTGRSYRAKDADLIAFKAKWARLNIHTEAHKRVVKLVHDNDKVARQFEIDGHHFSRLPLNQTIPVVLFEPSHMQLLQGPPEMRRNFVDDLIEQTVSGYSRLRSQYKRTLAQRNALLKKGRPAASKQLFAWNVRLSELGGQIATERQKLIANFNQAISKHYSRLATKRHSIELHYETTCNLAHYSSQLLHHLEKDLEVDIARGFTSLGPHRDDLVVFLRGKPAGTSASRGETRTVLLALKLLELQLIEQSRQQPPLLLLDDVFSELDGSRRRALTKILQDHQSFITTTDADVVVQHFMGKHNIIPIQ